MFRWRSFQRWRVSLLCLLDLHEVTPDGASTIEGGKMDSGHGGGHMVS